VPSCALIRYTHTACSHPAPVARSTLAAAAHPQQLTAVFIPYSCGSAGTTLSSSAGGHRVCIPMCCSLSRSLSLRVALSPLPHPATPLPSASRPSPLPNASPLVPPHAIGSCLICVSCDNNIARARPMPQMLPPPRFLDASCWPQPPPPATSCPPPLHAAAPSGHGHPLARAAAGRC